MTPVTLPFLPPKGEYEQYVDKIWQSGWITNMGPLSVELEDKLKAFLSVDNLLFVTSGTIALQMAVKALNLTGEIITTPFSFVATSSTIAWEGCKPIYVDIDKNSLNIDATKIEAAITSKTSAILATHVYGNPCDIEKIEQIAKKHNLKVIYDAAHAFNVQYQGKSVFEYGDISICSLHATKLYHSIEGGFLVSKSDEINQKLEYIRNFGFNGPTDFVELGLNGKNSEFHAAMGLVNLNYVSEIIEKRKILTERYNAHLEVKGIWFPSWSDKATINYAYYPIIFDSEAMLVECQKQLREKQIFTRRYFYPALSVSLPYIVKTNLQVADEISSKVLCLPLYFALTFEKIDEICQIILNVKNPF
jgi:dTDP-4-amino-4,6-dideoxygalactose transaminase